MDTVLKRQENERRARIGARLRRASFRLEMAQLERCWAVVSAHRDGWSVRNIGTTVGLSATRVHQLLCDPGAALMEQLVSVMRVLGWPAPEEQSEDDRELVADRLTDEAALLVKCIEWLEQLSTGKTPVINLRPDEDWPDTNHVAIDQERVLRILRRIASDIDELARARRVTDLSSAHVEANPRRRHRRRLAEPPLEAPKGPMSIHQGRQAWDEYARRLQRAGLPVPLNPYRHLDRSGN